MTMLTPYAKSQTPFADAAAFPAESPAQDDVKLSERPIFIVGAPRSGTSIMCQTIDAHPQIMAPYWETGLFLRFHELLSGHLAWVLQEHRASFPLQREELIQWIRASIEGLFLRLAPTSGKRRWAEKTPAHVFHMDLIHEVFPQAQFVHMLRHGRDVVRSLQNMSWAPRQIRWSIRRWMDSVQAGRAFGAKLPAEQYCEIRYEDFISQPEATLRQLCEFLGEPYAPEMLASHEPQNNSWKYAFKPLQGAPVGQYRPLNLVERFLFNRLAGRLMRDLDYK